ncbi:MAG: carbon-nitrogen hydrolase family protein [Spirochaetes bacterium]|nr:carbon-nitrogen hydrolase family protein [Spirochaetota bacterium]
MQEKTEKLKIAIIHPEIKYSAFKDNCDSLTAMNIEAGRNGAKIILNTEMGLSGYSFQSREELRGYTVDENSEIIKKFSRISAEYGNYIVLGAAYRSAQIELIYNSSFVFGPSGEIILRYNKVNSESKWAARGSAVQNNVFDTPWGKVGVLICADSYFALLNRATALRGAQMILVSANWPNVGIDPVDVWKGRALENELWVLAANRTGKDNTMDLSEAHSCVLDYDGNFLIKERSKESKIFYADIPLENGKIINRSDILKSRRPSEYGNIYLDFRGIEDIASHLSLPAHGDIKVRSCSFIPDRKTIKKIDEELNTKESEVILVFPEGVHQTNEYLKLSEKHKYMICFRDFRSGLMQYITDGRLVTLESSDETAVFGPAKISFPEKNEIFHPERFLHHSKKGCDLCIISSDKSDERIRFLLKIRTIERAAVAAAFNDHSIVCLPPRGHERWLESADKNNGYSELVFNTSVSREKRFYHDFDYELLLATEKNN